MPVAVGHAELPYAPGDYWKYAVTAQYTYPHGIFELEGNYSVWVRSSPGGDVEEVNLLQATELGVFGDFRFQSLIVVNYTSNRTWTVGTVFLNGTFDQGGLTGTAELPGSFRMLLLETTWVFPLSRGMRFRTEERIEAHTNMTTNLAGSSSTERVDVVGRFSTDWVVGPLRNVSVPAGSFRTTIINYWTNTTRESGFGSVPYLFQEGRGLQQRIYYAPEVGRAVGNEAIGEDGSPFWEEVLVEFHYTGAGGVMKSPFQSTTFWLVAVLTLGACLLAATVVVRMRRGPGPPAPAPGGGGGTILQSGAAPCTS
jgi:hypothetical protein